MKSGFGICDTSLPQAELQIKVVAMLRVFAREALTVAGLCALARGAKDVLDVDMGRALRFVSRTLLYKPEFEELYQKELVLMEEEEDEEEEEEGSEEGEEGSEEGEDEEEEGEGEEKEGEDEEEENVDDAKLAEAVRIAAKVKQVSESWSSWAPDDPVEVLLKRSVDTAYCEA